MVCSVMFNFLGRDFFTALSNKDVDKFTEMLVKWLCALCAGIPVFVFRDYYQACAGRSQAEPLLLLRNTCTNDHELLTCALPCRASWRWSGGSG